MLTQPTIEKLHAMKLTAMAQAFTEQLCRPDLANLSFEERFGLLVDSQMTALDNRRLHNRLKTARLRLAAAVEDLDFRANRNLDRATVMSLAQNHRQRAPQHPGDRTHRCRQELPRLRPGPESLSGWLHHPLPARPPDAAGLRRRPP